MARRMSREVASVEIRSATVTNDQPLLRKGTLGMHRHR
jgi:hypothetical protein